MQRKLYANTRLILELKTELCINRQNSSYCALKNLKNHSKFAHGNKELRLLCRTPNINGTKFCGCLEMSLFWLNGYVVVLEQFFTGSSLSKTVMVQEPGLRLCSSLKYFRVNLYVSWSLGIWHFLFIFSFTKSDFRSFSLLKSSLYILIQCRIWLIFCTPFA